MLLTKKLQEDKVEETTKTCHRFWSKVLKISKIWSNLLSKKEEVFPDRTDQPSIFNMAVEELTCSKLCHRRNQENLIKFQTLTEEIQGRINTLSVKTIASWTSSQINNMPKKSNLNRINMEKEITITGSGDIKVLTWEIKANLVPQIIKESLWIHPNMLKSTCWTKEWWTLQIMEWEACTNKIMRFSTELDLLFSTTDHLFLIHPYKCITKSELLGLFPPRTLIWQTWCKVWTCLSKILTEHKNKTHKQEVLKDTHPLATLNKLEPHRLKEDS